MFSDRKEMTEMFMNIFKKHVDTFESASGTPSLRDRQIPFKIRDRVVVKREYRKNNPLMPCEPDYGIVVDILPKPIISSIGSALMGSVSLLNMIVAIMDNNDSIQLFAVNAHMMKVPMLENIEPKFEMDNLNLPTPINIYTVGDTVYDHRFNDSSVGLIEYIYNEVQYYVINANMDSIHSMKQVERYDTILRVRINDKEDEYISGFSGNFVYKSLRSE